MLAFQQKLRFSCTAQWLEDEDGRPRKAYRLDVLAGAKPRVLCAVEDICGSEDQARQLEALLTRNQVSPKHVIDVLEDWLS